MNGIELHNDEATALFIDGRRTRSAVEMHGITLDYIKMLADFREQSRLVHAYYYDGEPLDPSTVQIPAPAFPDAPSNIRTTRPMRADETTPMHSELCRRGYIVRPGITHADERPADVNTLMTYDIASCENFADHLVVFSPRRALAPILRSARNKGPRVTVVGYQVARGVLLPEEQAKCLVAQAIRRNCDQFVDLMTIAHQYAYDRSAAAGAEETA